MLPSALVALLAAASAATLPSPAQPYRLSAAAVSVSGDMLSLRGRVCRLGMGQPGPAVVEISALTEAGGSAPAAVFLDGDRRSRAGGCAYYSARLPSSAAAATICVRSRLSGERPVCRGQDLP